MDDINAQCAKRLGWGQNADNTWYPPGGDGSYPLPDYVSDYAANMLLEDAIEQHELQLWYWPALARAVDPSYSPPRAPLGNAGWEMLFVSRGDLVWKMHRATFKQRAVAFLEATKE
jgi:hypothetical protein